MEQSSGPSGLKRKGVARLVTALILRSTQHRWDNGVSEKEMVGDSLERQGPSGPGGL
jgi:hypothetical protein